MKISGYHYETSQPEQTGCCKQPKRHVLRILARRFFCNVNDTRTLFGFCLLVTSQLGQIPDPWHSHDFTIAHIVTGL